MPTTPSEADPISLFLALAREAPEAPVCTWVGDDGADGETLTFGGLAADAAAIAMGLRERAGLHEREHVLIVMAPSLDFVRAFCACLLARLVPVPAYPPNPFNLKADLAGLRRIAADCGARVVLADAMLVSFKEQGGDGALRAEDWPEARLWAPSALATAGTTPAWRAPPAEEVAFLQYTSGSTAEPRGVRITHGNLAHQLACNRRELGLGPDTRAVMWVPQYHDLGLISGLVSALSGNGRLWQMSPLDFARRPALWLEVASRVRATHTAAPNFAFGLVLRKMDPAARARLKLDAIEVLMSAAEPISPAMVDAFFTAFAPAGLRREAFCAAYGLAEHTVGVSVGGQRALRLDPDALERGTATITDDARGTEIQGCGQPSHGVRVRVVDPATARPLAADRVGEIWVDSPSKAAGYHGLAALSAEVFEARTADPEDAHRYLRTGDLGFLHEGEIFVTGRLKDLMIFRGRNLLPSDVEATAASAHAAVRPGCVVAFSIPTAEGAEGLCVVADVRAGITGAAADEVIAAVAAAVQRAHGEPCHAVVLVAAGTVPKTTSGKLRRRACRDAFVRGELVSGPACVRATAPPAAAGIPGVETLDDSLRRLFARFVNVLTQKPSQGAGVPGAAARGTFTALAAPGLPRHRFFTPGARYPVLVRHTNSVREPDDAVVCGRSVAIRVLDPAAPDDLHRSLFDLPLQTGRLGLVRDAAVYVRWFVGDAAARAAMCADHPSIRPYFEDFFRDPPSYTAVHYHTQGTSHFIGADGGRYLARFRLVEAAHGRDEGRVPIEGTAFLGGSLPRRPDDTRSPAHLREDFVARVAGGGVRYRLAVQVRPEPGAEAERDDALDPTIPWDDPWHDLAEIALDAVVPNEVADPVAFNLAHAPPDLALVRARSARDPASVNHLRALVYDLARRLRRGEPLPESYQALLWRRPEKKARRVAVLGAGPSGLTAARELEKLGHEVTVIERAAEVGGMASTITVDGLPYDLGAHLCTGSYETVAALARELGVETEPTTGYFVLDLERGAVVPQDHSIFAPEAHDRYQRARSASFARADRPGLAAVATSLCTPVSTWLAAEGLAALGASMGTNYTAAGYGYLDDPDLAALYLVKFSEMIGALSPRPRIAPTWTFTIRGGFQRLWLRVAEELRDVRRGVTVDAVERRDDGVVLRVGSERWAFDDLLIAVQPDEALRVLDASPEERAVLGALRTFEYVTTVCTAEGLPDLGLYLIAQNCATLRNAGRSVAYHHRHAGSNVFLFYAYGDGRSDADLDDALRADIERLGGKLGEVRMRRRFRYLPHPTAEAIRAGFFARYEALQGHRRTYHAGSALGFELVECVASYARDLAARFFGGATTEEPRAAVEPAQDAATAAAVEAWLSAEIAAELDLPEPIPADADLGRYRIDSVVAASILGSLSHRIGWPVPPHLVFDQKTIAAIARGVTAARPAAKAARPALPARHLVPLRVPAPPRPVFCVGGMMGAALYLREIADAFPDERPFFAFQAPGLDGKEAPRDTVPALADLYLEELAAAQPEGPCTLIGHSFGGLVAYEMAARLVARGRSVRQLILLDTMLFAEGEPASLPDEASALVELLVAIRLKEGLPPDLPGLLHLSPEALREAIGRHMSLPEAFAGELSLQRWVEVYRAHAAAMRAFRPSPPGGFPILLLRAEEGYPPAIMHPARERNRCYDAPLLGWERLSPPALEVVSTPGNHYTMVFGDHARAAAARIARHGRG